MRILANGETVTIIRPGPPTQDQYGNDVPGVPIETDVPGCGIAPREGAGGGSEILQAQQVRDTVIIGLTLYAPYGTDLRATDKVRVAGAVYEVQGHPGSFASPFTGSTGPVMAALQLITG